MKTIIGEGWQADLTDEEFDQFWIYDEAHPHLARSISLENLLAMFLSHFRRGINLNNKPT